MFLQSMHGAATLVVSQQPLLSVVDMIFQFVPRHSANISFVAE